MQIGDMVVAKRDDRILGVLTAIDEWDRATVRLIGSSVEVIIHICDIEVVKEAGCDS